MDIRFDERLIAVGELPVTSPVLADRSQIENGWIEQRAASRGAIDKTGPVWQPRKPLEPSAARNLARLPACRRHDLERVGEREAVALKCQEAVVWRPTWRSINTLR
jgi:hypothetical protein